MPTLEFLGFSKGEMQNVASKTPFVRFLDWVQPGHPQHEHEIGNFSSNHTTVRGHTVCYTLSDIQTDDKKIDFIHGTLGEVGITKFTNNKKLHVQGANGVAQAGYGAAFEGTGQPTRNHGFRSWGG